MLEIMVSNKGIDIYRTDNEDEKTKAITDFHQLSPCVGMRRLERPTPTSRT